jgi:hypothetical protein
LVSGRVTRVAARMIRQKDASTKKLARQPKRTSTKPPRIGPKAGARAITIPM